jgi:hypothetical protein
MRTSVETPAPPMPEPGADPLASGGEAAPLPLTSADTATATPNTLSQPPTVSESDSVRGARLAENVPPPKSSSEDAPSTSPDASGTAPTPQPYQPPARHHQPEPPGEGASIRGSVDPGVISSEGDTRGRPTQAGPPNVASPAESLQARVTTGVDENRSPEQGMVETSPPEDAPMASRGMIAPNPEATIMTRPRVTRDSVGSPAPRSPAIITHTTAAPGAPEARVAPLDDQSRANARVSDPDRGAQDAEVPDRSGPVLPEAQPPGRPGGHTTQPAGGEPEGSRNRSLPPTAEGAMRTPTRLAPRTVQGQPERSGQGDEPQNSRNVPARSGVVPRSREDRASSAVETLAGSTVLAAREESASRRSRSQTIQVHIGKVEVRAVAPSPPAPAAPQAPKPQGFEGYELVRSYLSWERQ